MLKMYTYIHEKYKDSFFYPESYLKKYIYEELINFKKFDYSNWQYGHICSIVILKNEIFRYIPFTKENINIAFKYMIKNCFFDAFHINIAFAYNQKEAFNFLKYFLERNQNIPFIYIIYAIDCILNSKTRKKLIYDEVDKYTFFIPTEEFVTSNDILQMLQYINSYYKYYIHSWQRQECQQIINIIYDLTFFLIRKQLMIKQINYELLKIKKRIFLICGNLIKRKSLLYSYNKLMLKQIIIDYYFIFHKKRNNIYHKNFIQWVSCHLENFNKYTKEEIYLILRNIKYISFKRLQLKLNNL